MPSKAVIERICNKENNKPETKIRVVTAKPKKIQILCDKSFK